MGNQQASREATLQEIHEGLIWLGCFFDSEGCVSTSTSIDPRRKNGKRGGTYIALNCRLQFTNTSGKMLEKAMGILEQHGWPYCVGQRTNLPRTRISCYDITIGGMKRIQPVLPVLIPYLVGKRQQAELLLELIQSRLSKDTPRAPHTTYELDLVRRIRELNRPSTIPEWLRAASTTVRRAPDDLLGVKIQSELTGDREREPEVVPRLEPEVI